MIRSIPKYPLDRVYGEGDAVLRDSQGRIFAWSVGTTEEDWKKLIKANPGSYESIAYYDVDLGMIV